MSQNKSWELENILEGSTDEKRQEAEQLKVGSYAKLIFKMADPVGNIYGERMWVRVTRIHPDSYEGVLDNDPEYIEDLKDGDKIQFSNENILEVGEF